MFSLQTCSTVFESALSELHLHSLLFSTDRPKYIVVLNMYIEECKLLQSWLERVVVCNGGTPGDQQPNQSKPARKNTHMGK